MRHLRRFNESKYEDLQQDINYAIGFVIDKLGDPDIKKEKWGDQMKFIYTWQLGMTISYLNRAEDLINKLKDIMEEIDDIIAAKDRLPDYDIYMSLSTKLTLVFLPKNIKDGDYKFLIGQDGREIILNKSETERFFRNRDAVIINIRDEYNEISEIGSLHLTIDKQNREATREFSGLLDSEIRNNDNIDVDIYINPGSSYVEIYPESEKRYIIFR